MIPGQHRHELLGDELLQAQPVALDPLGDRQKGQIELVDAQHLGELLARLLAHGELDAGMASWKIASASETSIGPIVCIAPTVTRPSEPRRPCSSNGGLELGEDAPGPRDQELAGVGDRYPPRGPLHERQPDLLLQPPDLCERAGWAMCSRAAARVNCRSSASATRYRS